MWMKEGGQMPESTPENLHRRDAFMAANKWISETGCLRDNDLKQLL